MTFTNGKTHATVAQEPSPQALHVDDFLRRKLRVGDPRSVKEIADALRARYADEAQRIDAEGKGQPLAAQEMGPAAARGDRETAGSRAFARALANTRADLDKLLADPATREWVPELGGWRSKLLQEVNDGAAAARFAQDAAQRERAFLSVRRLGEYARVARLIGLADAEVLPQYRRLARSLDTCAAAIRIFVGEALDAAGLGEGGIVMAVPVTDARQRRDALVAALRRLAGTTTEGRDHHAGGAYAWLLKKLDSAAPELRVYLREATLAQALDDMLAEVSRQDPEALRTVASTAPITLAHLGQLRDIRVGAEKAPASNALGGFFETLAFFVDAFGDAKSGARFVELALPVPLGAEDVRALDTDGRHWLGKLVHGRAEYAYEVDRWAAERCGDLVNGRKEILTFDNALYLVDRAVDFFLQGNGRRSAWKDEEVRAGAYVSLAQTKLDDIAKKAPHAPVETCLDRFAKSFVNVIFRKCDPPNSPVYQDVEATERAADAAWLALAASLSPRSVEVATPMVPREATTLDESLGVPVLTKLTYEEGPSGKKGIRLRWTYRSAVNRQIEVQREPDLKGQRVYGPVTLDKGFDLTVAEGPEYSYKVRARSEFAYGHWSNPEPCTATASTGPRAGRTPPPAGPLTGTAASLTAGTPAAPVPFGDHDVAARAGSWFHEEVIRKRGTSLGDIEATARALQKATGSDLDRFVPGLAAAGPEVVEALKAGAGAVVEAAMNARKAAKPGASPEDTAEALLNAFDEHFRPWNW